MAKPWEIEEALSARTGALLPVRRPGKRGPVPLDDRKCLLGIQFVLCDRINWKHLPPELSFGSGITCWRRFCRWCEAEVWDRFHCLRLSELHALGEMDWSTVCWL
ncbi:transposase [Glycomyces sp. NPDC047010]|uniref:transposase n=1 Tax=Glycomyces sp. NPDC047010 TaxID=3155023 RepID=UPI0033DB6913